MVTCSNGQEDCKSFKILGSGIGFKGGRYVAQSKSVAAKRAGSKIFQKIDKDPKFKEFKNKKSVKFILGESTKGSDKKTTAYEVTRKNLAKPIVTVRNGVEVEYKYTYDVKTLNKDNEIEKMMSDLE